MAHVTLRSVHCTRDSPALRLQALDAAQYNAVLLRHDVKLS